MALTAEQWEMIAVDMLTGREPRVTGPEADEARRKLQRDFDLAKRKGWEIDLPFEVMREDL